MWNFIKVWVQNRYFQIINSIAFWPGLIGLSFLLLAAGAITFDYSETAKEIKGNTKWLSIEDASTARSIISAVAAGIISLTVFSFSMVMIVLNQAASHMSNRVLNKLIGNRFQQIVLGIYIGTIVYAFFLLSTIRDIDSGIYIPSISTYLLILITIFDIFLFIYFLHYITQSVKYEVIVQRIYSDTRIQLEKSCTLQEEMDDTEELENAFIIKTERSGVYEGFNESVLLNLCQANDLKIYIIQQRGNFVLKDNPVIKCNKQPKKEIETEIHNALFIHTSESIEANFYYGFRQLMEVAIKALSPGVNDPGTAVVSLRALFQLLAYRACRFPKKSLEDNDGKTRIVTHPQSFEQIFIETILPIWDYGKEDRMIQKEMKHMLLELLKIKSHPVIKKLLIQVDKEYADH